ncbi:MAG: putative Rhomboid family protein [Labilithrix sp.]|nr:putative Rhomboid family protein [Labilithrix sp.]
MNPPALAPSMIVGILIASVVVVSVAAWVIPGLKGRLLLSPYAVRHRGQVYRLLTGGWVHADATHLLFNMVTLYFFADRLAAALGVVRFLVLYVSAVVAAHVPTTLRRMNDPRYGSLGASGAVAAVIFSSILLFPEMKLSLLFLPIAVPGFVYGLAYLAYSAYSSYRARDGVNHSAHFAGAVYGAALTFVMEPERSQRAIERLLG